MISKKIFFLLNFVYIIVFFFSYGCRGTVKEPSVEGAFYPAGKENLTSTVDEFLSMADDKPVDGKLIALISPHAGYQYSGAVAAYSYKHLKGRDIKTVILIGPSHHAGFSGASVYERGSWKNSLGTVSIDSEIAGALINKDADIVFNPDVFEKEHSLEVQLPFLQSVLMKFKIVPVLIGTPTRQSFDSLTSRITDIMRKNDGVILVASTDLSHYHNYETAVKMDSTIIDAVERMSIDDAQGYMMRGEAEMCGGNPVIYTLAIARNLGATNGVLYRYANSGDVTGDKARVVGYAAMGIYQSSLTDSEQSELLTLAKNTITSYVTNGNTPIVNMPDKRLKANGATFVTIKTGNGMLRGCIGNIQPDMSLYSSVINNAVNACSKDPRFNPVTAEELKDITIEVTVLSPLEPLEDKDKIEIGKHGLYIVKDNRSGILLPQVPVEFGWDRETFLKQVSKKAGLPEDAWKEAKLYTFTAEIIR